jgi:hypothetical protein
MKQLILSLLCCVPGVLAAAPQPQLQFLTYLGGSRLDHPAGNMTVDRHGYIYLAGTTRSADFPVTPGAFDTTFNDTSGNTDAFVMKLDPAGHIIWSTFIGTPTRDEFNAIEVDEEGYVYLAGSFGKGAPITPGALQTVFAGGVSAGERWDGYLAKLKPDGSGLVWATYLGTASDDSLRGMDIDADGNPVVVSRYQGGAWPRKWFTGSFQDRPQGGVDDVVIKVSKDGSHVLWASYLGGSGDESKSPNVAVGPGGEVHVLTSTRSADAPTTSGAYDRHWHGDTDIYLATLSADGRRLLMGTYLGSPAGDGAGGKRGIQLAPDGNIIISGWTMSAQFPTTPGAARRTPLDFAPWGATGVTARFSPTGQLLASTYIGDSEGVSVDSAGNVYVALRMYGTQLPVTANALQRRPAGGGDGALLVLSRDLHRLLYASWIGGSSEDSAALTAVGPDDSVVVSGSTFSDDLPVRHAAQAARSGDMDVYLLRLDPLVAGADTAVARSPTAAVPLKSNASSARR